ncbi:hypothetical protein Vadar_002353 [Vaccinium darrowii]|uniref:Uncharacterized protein n=1 Tax=Vaccinium darrowii TaxID=229202 RepID=A0ACB7XG23_9ERIC|nr:hypothetical protein Vadar_002353 [Vaccinium darrowii]
MNSQESETDLSKFAFTVTRITMAQICQSVGFMSTQRSTLNTLTDIAARYLRALAESAAAYAASFGGTQSNLCDVVHALENLGSVQGFCSAWDVRRTRTLLASPTLVDLSKFVECVDEIPFAKPVPRCPPLEKRVITSQAANPTGVSHIPKWLPAFPRREISNVKETQEVERSEIGIELCGKVDGGCLVSKRMRVGLLLEKRDRVRFKMGFGVGRGKVKGGGEVGEGIVGVDLRNGVCRGGRREEGKGCHAKVIGILMMIKIEKMTTRRGGIVMFQGKAEG